MKSLDSLHATFVKWLGEDYDLDAIDAAIAAAAVVQLNGDPLWLLLVGGPGNAKTETVAALRDSGAVVVSSISSESALLSATGKSDLAPNATGGLLREVGDSGVMVLKDFTSILEMPHKTRGQVLAALREVYDGQWSRQVGEGGGRRLEWSGRIALVGAVTTAWDTHHAVVAEMGDRFVVLRLDSEANRLSGGRQAIANTGHEVAMRRELAHAVTTVLADVNKSPTILSRSETEGLLHAADLVTKARTSVVHDRNGNPTFAHASEMPTRYAKQLTQLVRGGVAIGLTVTDAMGLARRCARDSVPPLRLEALVFLADNANSLPTECARALDKPPSTVGRVLQELHLIGLVTMNEVTREENYRDANGRERTRNRTLSRYSLRDGVTTQALFPEIELHPLPPYKGTDSSECGEKPNPAKESGSVCGDNPSSSSSRPDEGAVCIFGDAAANWWCTEPQYRDKLCSRHFEKHGAKTSHNPGPSSQSEPVEYT